MDQGSSFEVIGLMSGTSLDGLDLAYCRFDLKNEQWHHQILETSFLPYQDTWKGRLTEASLLPSPQLLILHQEYGSWLGNSVRDFMQKFDLNPDFIASHGHTVFHQPNQQFTFQLGAGQSIANSTGKPVVCDFRTKDISLGGQGAPLVPIGDLLLFRQYDFCLNLGGIANISYDLHSHRIAYDIVHFNMVLNQLANALGKPFDEGGEIARKGRFNEALFESLNAFPYFAQDPPKSLGYEDFEAFIWPIFLDSHLAPEDQMHTAIHHMAFQIAQCVKSDQTDSRNMLISGGGTKNSYFLEVLRNYLPENVQLAIPEKQVVDFKEAMVFAFLGVLRWRNEINCLKSVTGARMDSSGGVIYYP